MTCVSLSLGNFKIGCTYTVHLPDDSRYNSLYSALIDLQVKTISDWLVRPIKEARSQLLWTQSEDDMCMWDGTHLSKLSDFQSKVGVSEYHDSCKGDNQMILSANLLEQELKKGNLKKYSVIVFGQT
jgi:hypothetical protein